MARLDEADEPKENVDIEEKEDVGQQDRVVIAPFPYRGKQTGIIILVVVEESEVEEYGGEGN